MKIAIVHDFLTQYGGAERFLETLHGLFKSDSVTIYTLRFKASVFPSIWSSYNILEIAANLPMLDRFPQLYAQYLVTQFEQIDFSRYDLVFCSDLIFAKFVICPAHVAHITYQHTPASMLYPNIFGSNARGLAYRLLTAGQKAFLRNHEYLAVQRVDRLLTNSATSGERIWRYYRRRAEVIYSFVDIPTKQEFESKYTSHGEYFLCISRLVSEKRVDLAVAACTRLNLPLVVAGEGKERQALERIAGPSVKFVGFVSDDDRANLYARSKALLCAGVEDFGLTALESMAWGKPVVSFRSGGVTETVVDGVTGKFFDTQSAANLSEALSQFDSQTYHPEVCREQAGRFSRHVFESKVKSIVDEVLAYR